MYEEGHPWESEDLQRLAPPPGSHYLCGNSAAKLTLSDFFHPFYLQHKGEANIITRPLKSQNMCTQNPVNIHQQMHIQVDNISLLLSIVEEAFVVTQYSRSKSVPEDPALQISSSIWGNEVRNDICSSWHFYMALIALQEELLTGFVTYRVDFPQTSYGKTALISIKFHA
ncbi:hypothetical protein STEG23_034668 [Scotinomys teguina]